MQNDNVPFGFPFLVDPANPRITSACERFEAAWRAGSKPRIEAFLDDRQAEDAPVLLYQLLVLELDHRTRCGERPTPEEYRQRFPEHLAVIDAAFCQAVTAAALADTASWQKPSTDPAAEQAAPAGPLAVGMAFGRFEIAELLGRGAFGWVYRARDPQLDRDVAIKIPRTGPLLDAWEAQRFLREARAAAQLRHPNIVPVHDAGRLEGIYYISSEYIQGVTLRARLGAGWRPTPREAAVLIGKLASALHHAHLRGIIHRDVKPDNVMLDVSGEPLVMDFGLARRDEPDGLQTEENTQMGTVQYMSPEQARGESHRADARSDLWSLGVTLYELLCRRRPFGGDRVGLLGAILNEEPPPPRKHNPSISKDLDTICLKCLAKDPEKRYASCQHLADELHRWLEGEAIEARPIGAGERAWRWCRRKPLVAGLAAVSLGLAVLVLIGAPLWAVRETALREKSDAETLRATGAESRAKEAAADARRNLAETNFQAARLAGERGQWRLALQDLEAALEAGHPDPIRVRLERLRAWAALEQVRLWGEEVDALAARADLGPYEAQVRLWQGIRLRSLDREEEGLKLIHRAVDMGLPKDDAEFGRAIIAETSPEAVVHLRRALQANPFHHQAMAGIVGLLFLLGQRDEARQQALAGRMFFPEDPTFPFALACISTLEGDSGAVRARTMEMERLCDKEAAVSARSVLELLNTACKIGLESDSTDVSKQVWAVVGTAVRFFAERAAMAATVGKGPKSPTPFAGMFYTARPVKDAYRLLLGAFTPDLAMIFNRSHARQIDALAQAAAIHPDGSFVYLRGALLHQDGRYAEAEAAALKAAETPASWPLCARQAWLLAWLAATDRHYAPGGTPEDAQRAAKHLRRYVESGTVTAGLAAQVFPTAFLAGDYELARRLLLEPLRQRPNDQTLLFWKAKLELATQGYVPAIEAADAMLRIDPKDKRAEQIKKVAAQRLRTYLQQADATPRPAKE